MLTISGLHKSFGSRDLFRDAGLFVGARDRVALVGLNGTGKTTLLEMITGQQSPDAGEIALMRGVVVGYLPQEVDMLRGRTLLAEVLTVASEVTDAGHRLEVLRQEMESTTGSERDRLVAEYGHLHDRFSTLGGYSLEHEAKRVLGGLGFAEDDLDRQTETFSGGWLMRIALAKLLVAMPDLLMLDEPTNHLDVESVEWLERFLQAYEGALLLISHDRDFINTLATRVVEIDNASLTSYTGDYEDFVRQRRIIAEQAMARAKNQERRRGQLEVFINRFRYKNTKAKQVQSKIKMLERMQTVDQPRRDAKKMGLTFPTPPRAGRVPLELQAVGFSYGELRVYESLDLAVERDYKLALVGPNGAGKSTLLKLLAGALDPVTGKRRVGHNARVAYFAQHQIDALDPNNTVLQELQGAIPPRTEVKPRDLLGRFLFSGDDIDKKVSVLSGGEKTRLALAKLLVTPANVLCLDEPTNHLDIPSRDVLEDALIDYQGALVIITHDRHLIRSVANRIIEVRAGNVHEFDGDYDYYLTRRDVVAEDDTVAAPRAAPKMSRKDERRLEAQHRAKTKKLRDRISVIEEEIEALRADNSKIEAVLGDSGAYQSGTDIGEMVREYEGNKRRAELLEEEWAEAALELERVDQENAGSSSVTR